MDINSEEVFNDNEEVINNSEEVINNNEEVINNNEEVIDNSEYYSKTDMLTMDVPSTPPLYVKFKLCYSSKSKDLYQYIDYSSRKIKLASFCVNQEPPMILQLDANYICPCNSCKNRQTLRQRTNMLFDTKSNDIRTDFKTRNYFKMPLLTLPPPLEPRPNPTQRQTQTQTQTTPLSQTPSPTQTQTQTQTTPLSQTPSPSQLYSPSLPIQTSFSSMLNPPVFFIQ